jgi:hypothetical protein
MAISAFTSRNVAMFCRVFLTFSALIVLGITAWAVQSSKSVTVVYSLVISCITVFYFFVLVATAFAMFGKPIFHAITAAMDLVLAFLWIASFVLLANNFSANRCSFSRWHGMVVCSRQHTAEAFSFIALYVYSIPFAY